MGTAFRQAIHQSFYRCIVGQCFDMNDPALGLVRETWTVFLWEEIAVLGAQGALILLFRGGLAR